MAHASELTSALRGGLGQTLSKTFDEIRLRTSVVLLHLQLGQLKRAMSCMSDAQLDEIGISRKQISSYAEGLMDI